MIGKKVLVLVNPISGRGQGARMAAPLDRAFRRHKLESKIIMTPGPGSASAIIEDMGEGFDAVAAVGGDGTISEVAGGIYFSGFKGPLGVVPLGLSNCLARHFHIPADLDRVVSVIAGGLRVKMGLAVIGRRVSLSFVGAGLDAEIANRVARGRTGPVNDWTYIKAAMSYFKTGQWPRLRVRVDERPVGGEYFQIILSAVNNYAHYFHLPHEPGFHLYLFRGGGPGSMLRVAGAMGWRRKIDRACETRLPVRERLDIESPAGPGCWQMDGEAGGFLPLRCEVVPEAIEVLAPYDFRK